MRRHYQPGDWVVYRKVKHGPHPAPDASEVIPARQGDDYTFAVHKYRRVLAVTDNTVVLQTRRGRQRAVKADDPNLRRAHWWERLLHRDEFPPEELFAQQFANN